jgi:hypothetical protein
MKLIIAFRFQFKITKFFMELEEHTDFKRIFIAYVYCSFGLSVVFCWGGSFNKLLVWLCINILIKIYYWFYYIILFMMLQLPVNQFKFIHFKKRDGYCLSATMPSHIYNIPALFLYKCAPFAFPSHILFQLLLVCLFNSALPNKPATVGR